MSNSCTFVTHVHIRTRNVHASRVRFFQRCDSPHETHANPFLRFTDRVSHSVISSFSTPLLSSPFFSLFPSFFSFPSLSLSTLSAVTRHASTRFVSFVSNNCRQQNGTMRMQMIPFKLAHGSIFMRLNRRRGFLVRWFRKFFSSKSFSDRSRFKQVERWAWINGN